MRVVAILAGALLGMLACYEAGAIVMCDFVWPDSNLCGLPSAFVAAPIGLALGAIAGWRLTRSKPDNRDA